MTPEKLLELTKPNFIDKAIQYISPVRGAERMRSRFSMALAGAYVGASRTRRSLKEWITGSGDADADSIRDLPTLRSRSRDLIRNAPIAIGAVSTSLTNVVGTGLKLQARIDREYLKMNDDEADAWETNTEREFRLWAESKEACANRSLNFAGIQELVFRQVLENGDVFIIPKQISSTSPYTLKLQIIEADRISNKDNAPNSSDGNGSLIEGVRKDMNGAPVEYHICKQHPGTMLYNPANYAWDVIPAFGSKTGLRNVFHLFRMLRPDQTRGIPYIAPIIEPLKQLDRYTEAELAAAVIAALFTVFIKTESGDVNFDLTGMGAETGAKASDTDLKLASGAIIGLPKGQDIVTANPGRPNAAFAPFITAIEEQIGTALEIPYEIIIRHFSASYSASRAALLEAWRFFKGRRAWLATDFCQAVYDRWLYEAIVLGRVNAPGFFNDPMICKAYSGTSWVGDAPGYIDPAKDIDASTKRMSAGLSTLDEETTLQTGGDSEKNLPRIRRERKQLQDIGLWQPVQNKNAAPFGGQE